MDPIDPEIERYLEQLVAELQSHLGAGFVGAYLHGSLAMGAFDPGRSDIDVLAVCAGSLPAPERRRLGDALVALDRPGSDLEFSLVTEAAVRTPSPAPAFEVHVTSHDQPPVVVGGEEAADRDLVIHFAMSRERGRALAGPDPKVLFPAPDRALLLEAFLADLRWARDEGAAAWEGHREPALSSMAYRVLNAARSWRYLETGALGSKVEGAAWVRQQPGDAGDLQLIETALAVHRGETPELPPDEAVESFVGRIETMLRQEVG